MLAPEHLRSSTTTRMSKRRLACERCRNQKLKCIRSYENASEPCLRCLQSQAECIISLRKAPGRPAARNNSSSQHDSIQGDGEAQAKSLGTNEPHDPNPSADNGPITSEDLFDSPFDFSFDMNEATQFSPAPPLNEYMQDYLNTFLKSSESATEFPFTWSSSDGPSLVDRHQPYHLLDQNSDLGFQLSCLQQKLSKQLFLLRSLPWDITTVMKLESGPCCNGCTSSQPSERSQEFNPLTSTFEAISEFEHLLTTLRSIGAYRELPGTPGFRQEIDISYSLTAISCYLQLVSIYDCIFSYALDQASSNPVVREFILHSTPKISLGGFMVPPLKNFFGRLFVQLMQLKIRPIESALGLPEDLRISKEIRPDCASRRTGLLNGKQGESLLAALKGSGLGEVNSANTLGVQSLKDKMMRIESFE